MKEVNQQAFLPSVKDSLSSSHLLLKAIHFSHRLLHFGRFSRFGGRLRRLGAAGAGGAGHGLGREARAVQRQQPTGGHETGREASDLAGHLPGLGGLQGAWLMKKVRKMVEVKGSWNSLRKLSSLNLLLKVGTQLIKKVYQCNGTPQKCRKPLTLTGASVSEPKTAPCMSW